MSWRGVPNAASARLLATNVVRRCVSRRGAPTAEEETDNFKLLLWQSLCILFGLCDAVAPPCSITACKTKLETEVFVNIAVFVKVISRGGSVDSVKRYPTKKALKKAIINEGPQVHIAPDDFYD
ncbi:hypothetical protein RQP46_004598 [Phenoliferia psychrophenolica]